MSGSLQRDVTLAERSDDERNRIAGSIFIIYPRLKRILEAIEECRKFTCIYGEPQCLTITGPSHAGKSTIAKYFENKYPRVHEFEGDVVVPVVCAETPARPTEKKLAAEILKGLGDPAANKGTESSMTFRIEKMFAEKRVELVFLDELQHFVDRENNKVLKVAADWLKNLLNRVKKTMIILGMPGADRILDINEQLKNRFLTRKYLAPFAWSTEEQIYEYRNFLRELDMKLPLRKDSNLAERKTALRMYCATSGIMGKNVKLIRAATKMAIAERMERLDLEILGRAFDEIFVNDELPYSEKIGNPFSATMKDLNTDPPPLKIEEIQATSRHGGTPKVGVEIYEDEYKR